MEYKITPPSIAMARSSMIYKVYDPTADSGTPYELVIYIWRGDLTIPDQQATTHYNLIAYPDAAGYGTFNVSKLVSGSFSDLDYEFANEYSNSLTTNFKAGVSVGGGTVLWETNTNQATYGYNLYSDDINKEITQANDGFLTDTTYARIPIDGYYSVFLRRSATSTTTALRIQPLAVALPYWDIPINTAPVGESAESLLNYGIGIQDFDDSGGLYPSIKYSVTPVNVLGAATGASIILHAEEGYEPCKYGNHKLDFINKYGVWETTYLWGNDEKSLSVTKKEHKRYIAPQHNVSGATNEWKQGVGQFVDFNKMGVQSISVSTGWVDEVQNDLYEQLFMSERIVLDGLSVRLVDSNFVRKTSLTNKMIDYKFLFTSSFDYKNSIG